MTLKELQIGKSAVVDTVGGSGALRQHFLDMGLIPGAEVTLVKLAPMGDPMELRIHGYELTLRLDDAAQITVTPTEKTPPVGLHRRLPSVWPYPGQASGPPRSAPPASARPSALRPGPPADCPAPA